MHLVLYAPIVCMSNVTRLWASTCYLFDGTPPNRGPDNLLQVNIVEVTEDNLIVSCSFTDQSPKDAGYDFLVLEVSHEESSDFTRLGSRSLGLDKYDFPGWEHLAPGVWVISAFIWYAGYPTIKLSSLMFIRRFSDIQQNRSCLKRRVREWREVKESGTELQYQVAKPSCLQAAKGIWHTNDASGFQNIRNIMYIPFTCAYKTYTPEDAIGCLNKIRPSFALGDSLLRALSRTVNRFANNTNALQFTEIVPARLGLRSLLHFHRKYMISLVTKEGSVFINSLLHDISHFAAHTPSERFRSFAYNTVHSISGKEYEKNFPVLGYIHDIYELADLLSSVSVKAKLFWVFDSGMRMSSENMQDCRFPNQPERVLCIQHHISPILTTMGFILIDLSIHSLDAPPHWFHDEVHPNTGSGFLQMSAQIFFNVVCNV